MRSRMSRGTNGGCWGMCLGSLRDAAGYTANNSSKLRREKNPTALYFHRVPEVAATAAKSLSLPKNDSGRRAPASMSIELNAGG